MLWSRSCCCDFAKYWVHLNSFFLDFGDVTSAEKTEGNEDFFLFLLFVWGLREFCCRSVTRDHTGRQSGTFDPLLSHCCGWQSLFPKCILPHLKRKVSHKHSKAVSTSPQRDWEVCCRILPIWAGGFSVVANACIWGNGVIDKLVACFFFYPFFKFLSHHLHLFMKTTSRSFSLSLFFLPTSVPFLSLSFVHWPRKLL